MKSFIDFISEQNRADLYHGTPFDNLHSILRSGKIKASDNGHVSLSRDKKYVESGHGDEAYFNLNHETLKHHHKIIPTDWHMGGSVKGKHHEDGMQDVKSRRSESEESVKGHIPLKHVKELVVQSKHYNELVGPKTDYEKDIEAEPDMAWLYKGNTYKDRLQRVKKFHSALKKHGIKLTVKDYRG
jgi:hypothetical protein